MSHCLNDRRSTDRPPVRNEDNDQSLLQALGKSSSSNTQIRTSAIPIPPPSSYIPPSSTSSHFPDSISGSNNGDIHETASSRGSIGYSNPIHSSRSVSGMSVAGKDSGSGQSSGKDPKVFVKRPEDVFKVVKERVLSWSYLMQWYQG